MVVMIGENRFGTVAEVQEELNVSRRTQHGAGIQLMGIGGRSLNLTDQSLSHSSALMSGAHGKQSDHADAGYCPEAYGTDDRSSFFGHENMFLLRIFLQALERFCGPAAGCIDAGIFTERRPLNVEERRKICFGSWSNVNHNADPRLGKDSRPYITDAQEIRKYGYRI